MAKKKKNNTKRRRRNIRAYWFTIALLLLSLFFMFKLVVSIVDNVFDDQQEKVIEEEPSVSTYYDVTKFNMVNGFMDFSDSNYTYTSGIDVSQFQHDIDWESVATVGLDFAMIRAGYRGAIEGQLHYDEAFYQNIEGALENGIGVGVYWYSSALNVEELQEEIDCLLEMIDPYTIAYPVVFDMEPYEQDENGGRIHVLSVQEKTDLAIYFCQAIEEAGYTPMIYGNQAWLYGDLNISQILNYEIWYAAYLSKPVMPDRFDMWQYSNQGRIPGIDTNVDMNIYIKERK